MIKVSNITKMHSRDSGVFALNFEIKPNSLTLLLGPNGAGKSTCLKILATLETVDEGTVSIAGFNLRTDKAAIRECIGYLPEKIPYYTNFTVYEYLNFVGSIRGLEKKSLLESIDRTLISFNLYQHKDKVCSSLSKGMLQSLGVCQSVLHSPKVLLLDEPGSGLDVEQLQNLVELLSELKKTTSILLSTHYANCFNTLADQVLTLNNGKIVNAGKNSEVIQLHSQKFNSASRIGVANT